jgi:hypothetical protein
MYRYVRLFLLLDCSTYRGLTLSTTYIQNVIQYSSLKASSVRPRNNWDLQCGYRRNRSTIDQTSFYIIKKKCIILYPCYQHNQIKEDWMGRACITHGDMRNACTILFENLKGRDHSKNLGVDGRIILNVS